MTISELSRKLAERPRNHNEQLPLNEAFANALPKDWKHAFDIVAESNRRYELFSLISGGEGAGATAVGESLTLRDRVVQAPTRSEQRAYKEAVTEVESFVNAAVDRRIRLNIARRNGFRPR